MRGYYDPTAGIAVRNIEQEERRSKAMSIKRGDIYYIESIYSAGSEQRSGRPAIVVSNNKLNETSGVVEVVYLTTQPKPDLPTHVRIRSTARESTALCEQITSVAVERVGAYKGRVTDAEMTNLEIAMLISLDLSMGGAEKEKVVEVVREVKVPVEVPVEVKVPEPVENAETLAELASYKAKCEVLQTMYENLLGRVVGVKA